MKRTLLTALMLLAIPLMIFAGSYYSAGASGFGGAVGDSGMIGGAGIYFDTYYAYNREGSSLSHGFGTMIECDMPVNRRGVLMNILTGWAMEWDVSNGGIAEITTLIGPSYTCSIGRNDGNFISIGAGLEVNGNFYLNKERNMGIRVGVKGICEGTNLHDATKGNVEPAGWFCGNIGFCCKFGPDWRNLPSHSYVVAPELDENKKN